MRDILNSILTNDNRGLLVNATGSASVHGSNLTGNSTAAIVNGTATTVDASGNWFGTASEAGVLAMTTGPVDFTPYLNVGTDTDGGARGFGGDFSHLHVTALGGQTSGGRISEALGYLADGTLSGGSRIIDVHAGTYVDNVAVNKSVRLPRPRHHGRRRLGRCDRPDGRR